MQEIIDSIKLLYREWTGKEPESLDVLPQSGSDRRYFRLFDNGKSVIGTYGANVLENETFLYFSKLFKKKNLAVPELYAMSENGMYYLQEDFGDISLLNHLESQGLVQPVYDLFR